MRRTYLGALLALVLALAVIALLVALAGPAEAAPTYINGDWTVGNGDTVTRTNEEIILTSGSLTVETGGELTLRNVTLRINSTASTRYHIEVENGGTLYIYDGDSNPATTSDASLITANNTAYNYAWWVQDGGALYINDSRVEECGVANPADDRGLNIESSSCVIDSVAFKSCYYGLYAYYASPTVRDCSFTDCTSVGVYLYSASTDVLMCSFSNCPYGVLAYYSSPKVTDSTFSSSSTYGIYVYDAAAEVDGCTLTDMAYIGVIASYNSVTITDTTVEGPGSYGIYAQYTTLTCARNDVDDFSHGLYLYRNYAGSSVADCKATNCSSNGVYVYLSPITLTDVRAYDFSTNGIQLYQASGAMTDLWAEGGPTGLYLRSSTSTVSGLTVKGATTAGIAASGGSPTVRSFAVTGSATGLSVYTSSTFTGYDGSMTGSTTRDVDVSGTSTATLTNVTFSMSGSRVQDAGSSLRRQWWVDLHGVWQDGSPVSTGTYTVRDSSSTVVASGALGTDGWVQDIQVRQALMTSSGTTTYTPHTFSVAKGGLSGSTTATIDTNKQVTVTVTDDVAPSGYVLASEPLYTKGTWNQVSWSAGSDVGVGGIEYWCEMSDVSGFA
jgi:hypothetical protein